MRRASGPVLMLRAVSSNSHNHLYGVPDEVLRQPLYTHVPMVSFLAPTTSEYSIPLLHSPGLYPSVVTDNHVDCGQSPVGSE